jgi:hypothetical protein
VEEARPGLGVGWHEGGACVSGSVVSGGYAVEGWDGVQGGETVDCPKGYVLFVVGFGED